MAETPTPPGNPWEMVWFIGGILLVLFAIWWVRGGPRLAQQNGEGLFLSPTTPLQNNQPAPQQ
jgi:hypothetical protein